MPGSGGLYYCGTDRYIRGHIGANDTEDPIAFGPCSWMITGPPEKPWLDIPSSNQAVMSWWAAWPDTIAFFMNGASYMCAMNGVNSYRYGGKILSVQ
ncbi:MAG: hypothetical protein QOE94_2368 [Mycobacterium sp.]|nr:hypothetical protein [Mycobacterium sp.]